MKVFIGIVAILCGSLAIASFISVLILTNQVNALNTQVRGLRNQHTAFCNTISPGIPYASELHSIGC